MTTKRPKGVTFIGYLYIFGAIVLLLTLILNIDQDVPINLIFGVPHVPDSIVIPCIAIIWLAISCGYLGLEKWGYWFMMIYSSLLLLISLYSMTQYQIQPFIGNAIWSIIMIGHTYEKRNSFLYKNKDDTY